MADNVPSTDARRIDRAALERIIQRAAELQAGEMDTGDALTEPELLQLGADVGIDGRFLRQALYEETSGTREAERGLLARWFGPGGVAAGRVVPGEKAQVDAALDQWMAEGEALAVKRRLPDRTVWEKQRGFFAEVKRGIGAGGKNYVLAKAHEVSVAVTQLEPGYCHVELLADVHERRTAVAVGSSVGSGLLVATGAGLALIGAMTSTVLPLTLVAMAPLGAAVIAPIAGSKGHRRFAARVQLALEQVLDRLEHGEIKPRHQEMPRGPLGDVGALIVDKVHTEIRRAIGEAAQRPPRRLPRDPHL